MVSNEDEIVEKSSIDLDTILVEEIGQFGWYQLRTVMVVGVVAVFAGWHSEFVFTTGRINTRCLIPECDSAGSEIEFAPSWILNAVPGTSVTSFDHCQRFANTTSIVEVNNTCPAIFFDREILMNCDEYVYSNTDTIVYDYNMGCDEWRRSLIGTVRQLGMLFSLPITGFVSDRWGRRTALTISAFNNAWIGILRYFAGTYIGFTISQFVEALTGSGVFSCSYVLMMELVGPKLRVYLGASMSSCFALGQVILGLIAWAVPNWKHLTLAVYAPQLLTISCFWLVSESMRWYISKGHFEKFEKALKKITSANGKKLSEKSLLVIKQAAEIENKNNLSRIEQKVKEQLLIVQVFHHKPILIRCIVTPVWWVSTTLIYYGLTINAVNISGNQYVNFMVVSAVEIPGFFLAVVLMGKFGRKPVMAGAFWICAACQVGYLFMPEGMYEIALTVYMIGKCCIAMVVTSVYVYTNELYPTKYRHSLFAFSSMIGRIGSMTAPLTPAFGDRVPFILFGSFALVSGLLVLLTPETLGTKLPNTMEEAANLGKVKRTV